MGVEALIKFLWDYFRNIDWSFFVGILSTVGDICLFWIAVYTFRLTVFPKKLKFINFREKRSTFGGASFEITLENRSLCPVIITSLELVYGLNRIKVFDGYLVIDGFKAGTIVMEPYSFIDSVEGKIDIDILSIDKMSLWIQTSRGVQHVRYKNISDLLYKYKHRKYLKWIQTTVVRNKFNDKILVPGIKFAISFVDAADELYTVFIHKSGMMSDALFGYNSLPKEIVENEEMLRKHFNTEFEKHNLFYSLKVFEEGTGSTKE